MVTQERKNPVILRWGNLFCSTSAEVLIFIILHVEKKKNNSIVFLEAYFFVYNFVKS